MEIKFKHPDQHGESQLKHDGFFNHPSRGLEPQSIHIDVEKHELNEADIYVLKNCDEV